MVNIAKSDTLWYVVHSMGTTIANKTIQFTGYDDARFEVLDGKLYLVCEYREVDFNSYKYLVSFDGEDLILTSEEKK